MFVSVKNKKPPVRAGIRPVIFILAVMLAVMVPARVLADYSLGFEAWAATSLILGSYPDISGYYDFGSYEMLKIKLRISGNTPVKFYSSFNIYMLQGYYGDIASSYTNSFNMLFTADYVYFKIIGENIMLQAGLEPGIDLEEYDLDLFYTGYRLFKYSGFLSDNDFSVSLRYFPGDAGKLTLRYFPENGFEDDLYCLDYDVLLGGFALNPKAVFDSSNDWLRVGGNFSYSFGIKLKTGFVLHYVYGDGTFGYRGYEFKAGIQVPLDIVNMQVSYYYNGLAYSPAEYAAVFSTLDPQTGEFSSPFFNRDRFLSVNEHFLIANISVSPDPFFSLTLYTLFQIETTDAIFQLDANFVFSSGSSVDLILMLHPDTKSGPEYSEFITLMPYSVYFTVILKTKF